MVTAVVARPPLALSDGECQVLKAILGADADL